ncbi:amino acid ABC transporter permease [Polaromonas sp. A23]|uniref:amino acid ABC transporter permease n=1 Tax=Polaromonas sp. A23 TaxID=1944133 RepID=UPI00098491E1|nr:amino acid ABC transporter permease [Polaromonas sp. A23]OOG36676.1 amino acid ABC transporter permease [Polaromonas sp. A23]
MEYSFDWSTVVRGWPYLAQGMAMTLFLVVVAMVLGIVIGTLLAMARMFGPKSVQMLAGGYVNLFRSVPLILTIFWFYFLMPPVLRLLTGDPHLTVGAIYSALAAFTLAESAYYCEIMRAGIGSVRGGQMQAAQSVGLTRWQSLRFVILPQAFRNMTPSLINQTVALLKDTSLVYVISLNDFLGAASKLGQRDGRLVEMYLFVAAVYLALCTLGVWLVNYLQKRRGLAET